MKTYMYMLHKTEQNNVIIYKEPSVLFCSHYDPHLHHLLVVEFYFPSIHRRGDEEIV